MKDSFRAGVFLRYAITVMDHRCGFSVSDKGMFIYAVDDIRQGRSPVQSDRERRVRS